LKRRQFVRFGLGSLAAFALPRPASSFFETVLGRAKSLSLYHIHTGESLTTAFWRAGEFITSSLEAINHFLRDHRSGESGQIDPRLLDLLHDLSSSLGSGQTYHVICGFRSARTNELMWRQGLGVARNSLHVFGQAVDIRLPGCKLTDLRQAAIELKAGGVGFYPRSGFIHVDVGRVRSW
jgi:uncharacterized protein YcbK (DUF882 family)